MNELFQAAREIHEFLAQRGWRFCVIGGLAVLRWGEPQATQDVDISLLTGFGNEREYVEPILSRFPARIPDAAPSHVKAWAAPRDRLNRRRATNRSA